MDAIFSRQASTHVCGYTISRRDVNRAVKKNVKYHLLFINCRRTVWQDNIDYVELHNIEVDLGLHSYTLGENEYADLVCSSHFYE